MSTNPYQTPSGAGGSRSDAAEKLKLPAILMMVSMGLGIAAQILSLALNVLGAGVGAAAGGDEGMMNILSGTIGMVFNVIGMAIGGFVIFGMLKMMKLQSLGLVKGALIVGMVPCVSPCCLLGLPIGIWAMMTINKPEVSSQFS